MKFARKLNLSEIFYEKLNLFQNKYKNILNYCPYEIYCKDIQYIKFIRNNTYNYDLGIKICDECIQNYNSINNPKLNDFIKYITNNIKEHKAYFYYKSGKILQAHELFKEALIVNNKTTTNYHLYYDWADMCEDISYITKGDKVKCPEWFENTIHNFLYTIIYKLDKS